MFHFNRYTDESGGCDGCLNWEGVGFRHTEASKFAYSNVGATNNNGLGYTVEVLEGIYTDPTFPLVNRNVIGIRWVVGFKVYFI